MLTVSLSEQEWQQILTLLAQHPWNVANPLLMKVGEQLRTQAEALPSEPKPKGNNRVRQEA